MSEEAFILLLQRPGILPEALRHALRSEGVEAEFRYIAGAQDLAGCECKLVIFLVDDLHIPTAKLMPYIDAGIKVLVVLRELDMRLTRHLIQIGVSGVLGGSESLATAVAAVHFSMAGGIYAPAELIRSAWDEPRANGGHAVTNGGHAATNGGHAATNGARPAQPQSAKSFTRRERDILQRLRRGLQNKSIAFDLGISENTVKVHLHNIMTKLHATNRTQVVFRLEGGE
jgi:DNA-binding NarL/FixJ family response regulator